MLKIRTSTSRLQRHLRRMRAAEDPEFEVQVTRGQYQSAAAGIEGKFASLVCLPVGVTLFVAFMLMRTLFSADDQSTAAVMTHNGTEVVETVQADSGESATRLLWFLTIFISAPLGLLSLPLGVKLASRTAPKPIWLLRIDKDGRMTARPYIMEYVRGMLTPRYIADYADKPSLRAMLKVKRQSNTKLVYGAMVVGVVAAMFMAYIFYTNITGNEAPGTTQATTITTEGKVAPNSDTDSPAEPEAMVEPDGIVLTPVPAAEDTQ